MITKVTRTSPIQKRPQGAPPVFGKGTLEIERSALTGEPFSGIMSSFSESINLKAVYNLIKKDHFPKVDAKDFNNNSIHIVLKSNDDKKEFFHSYRVGDELIFREWELNNSGEPYKVKESMTFTDTKDEETSSESAKIIQDIKDLIKKKFFS